MADLRPLGLDDVDSILRSYHLEVNGPPVNGGAAEVQAA